MNFFDKINEGFKNYKLILKINASANVLLYSQLEEAKQDNLVIYVSKDYTLTFDLLSNVDKKNKDCIVATIQDKEMINKVSEIIEDYYIAGQYSLFVENLANLLGNKKESKKLSYEK